MPEILTAVRAVLILLCFLLAYDMENPERNRIYILFLIFAFLMISINIKEIRLIRESKLYGYTFLVDTLIIFLLEYNSKYLINYYIHAIYLILLVSAGISLPKKKGTFIGIVIFSVSIFKFLRLLSYNPIPVNISLASFNCFIFVMAIILIRYAKYLSEERERIKLLYSELKNYSEKVRELTIAEERNRIAIEIHDTIGCHMTGLITELEMCKRLINKDNGKVEMLLKDAADTARKGLVDTRRAVDALKIDNLNLESIKEMINQFKLKSSLNIDLMYEPEDLRIAASETAIIYRTIKEAITNVLKHSDADEVQIRIEKNDKSIKVHIYDNGSTIEGYKEGNGLSGIRTRIKAVGGEVRIYFGNGFNIDFSIPLGSEVKIWTASR
jgi:signal transduction histidine kinase